MDWAGRVGTEPPCQPSRGLLADASSSQSLPQASGVIEVTQFSIHQSLTHASLPVGLLEACGFELYYHGHALVSPNFPQILSHILAVLLSSSLFPVLGSLHSIFNSRKARCFPILAYSQEKEGYPE